MSKAFSCDIHKKFDDFIDLVDMKMSLKRRETALDGFIYIGLTKQYFTSLYEGTYILGKCF